MMALGAANVQKFWQAYLATVAEPTVAQARFYEPFQIGDSAAAATAGAALIRQGLKTATSSLQLEYERSGTPPPYVGALSVVLDGEREPVCLVETIRLETTPFHAVDEAFAQAYGEWDQTLARWRAECWVYYAAQSRALGVEPNEELILLCEWFRVVYP
jgi:uncharacterized protein YhfF